MRALYNIFFLVAFILSSPWYFFKMWRRGNWRAGFQQRFGEFDTSVKQSITNRHVVWMHAVSVGEVIVCAELIRELEPRLPNAKILVSTTTTTGMGELQKRLPSHVGKIYFPIDRRKYAARALTTLHPSAIILVESEIWPNFIWLARQRGIPLFLANARLSDRSFPRYRRFAFLFRDLFGSFTAVGAQSEADAVKLRELGCRSEAVHVVGSMKFDSAKSAGAPLDVPALLEQLGVDRQARVLVAGSTHAGEEEVLADIFHRLRARFPDLFLILVPRHFERARETGRKLAQCGLKLFYRTDISPETRLEPGAVECLLVNTTGELTRFYERATVAFIGKSLLAKGGQNPIEPAALGKPVVFGPNMQNFAYVVRLLVAGRGVAQVRDAAELEQTVGDLLADPRRRQELGLNAEKVVRENRGAATRTAGIIAEHLRTRDFHVAPLN